jgi:hypothetical protein
MRWRIGCVRGLGMLLFLARCNRFCCVVLRFMQRPHQAEKRLKKRRVQMDDAPSNRTFGNCLLGIHCMQKDRLGSRVIAGFLPVAAIRQRNVIHRFSTAWSGFEIVCQTPHLERYCSLKKHLKSERLHRF